MENLRAVGLRNKMAAMHEVGTCFGILNPHMQEERDVHGCAADLTPAVLATQERRRKQQELQQQLKEKQQELDR